MTPVIVQSGTSSVILAMPHGGTHLPEPVLHALNETGQALADTDWHIDRLYDGLLPDATIVKATFHRYLIDANRDPEGSSLYPGQNTTGLCPLTDFDGNLIHKPGEEPDEKDVMARVRAFHRPYHAALQAEIARVKALHGVAIVYDCHSIRSRIPFLFEGELPLLNIGTNGGVTCLRLIQDAAVTSAERSGFSFVLNGRFKGGWTTRHNGGHWKVSTPSRWRSRNRPIWMSIRPGITGRSGRSGCALCWGRCLHSWMRWRVRERWHDRFEPLSFSPAQRGDVPQGQRGPLRLAPSGRFASTSPLRGRGQARLHHFWSQPMTNPRHNIRDVYPATGSTITAKSWLTEAPMRMLMNNLHPDVAENPHELVVYGGKGRAARDWDSFDRIVATLKTLEKTRRCSYSPASRWAYSAPTRMRRAC